jgi:hypothetical protein
MPTISSAGADARIGAGALAGASSHASAAVTTAVVALRPNRPLQPDTRYALVLCHGADTLPQSFYPAPSPRSFRPSPARAQPAAAAAAAAGGKTDYYGNGFVCHLLRDSSFSDA